MDFALLLLFSALFGFSDHVNDPIHQGWKGRSHLRDLQCERLPQAEAHRRHPGFVPPTDMRSQTQMQIDALVCERQVVSEGLRSARDEAILSQLDSEVAAIVSQAIALSADDTRFMVDAFYPSPQMAGKIRTATLQELAEAGRTTSTKMPLLAAADIEIIQGLRVQDALPIACARLFAEGNLAADQAFVGVALIRAEETQLHGGLCQAGGWRWLR